MMNSEDLTKYILDLSPESTAEEGLQYLQVTIPSSDARKVLESLRNDENTLFDYMYCLSGVDYPEHMEVVYHLKSTSHNHEMVLKAKILDREKPTIDTVCDIWRTAEFHEREAYDFYGIVFKNHPDLRRIFLDDDWKGWPMRKDYKDPINMIAY